MLWSSNTSVRASGSCRRPIAAEPPLARKMPRDRRALKVFGTIFGALVGIVLLRAPIVAAFPMLNGLPAEVAQLEFQQVRSETVHLGGLSTLFVEGEIINRSGGDVSLPAIRITLHSPGGDAVTSWLVEPSRHRSCRRPFDWVPERACLAPG